MALTVQNLRAVGTGVEPASLLPGQIAFNITDKVMYVGDGSNFKTDYEGNQVPGTPGNGWYAMPMDFDSLGDYYVVNPEVYGDVPTDQQVLAWSTALNHPIWSSGAGGGGNQVYVVTNAQVASASGATTSDKITSAIGVASPDEGDVTIVTGLPDDVYEGLYFFTTQWVKGAAYAYPSASEVIYNNTGRTLGATVQAAIDDLDDGLIATTAIANTANSTANSALSIASAALPRAGGTMTGTIVARNIDVQTGYSVQFNAGSNGSLNGISDSVVLTSSTTAASSTALKSAYDLANAALARSGGSMSGLITFAPGQVFPISGIDIASTSQLGVVQVGTNINVTGGGTISVNSATTSTPGIVQLNDTTASTSVVQALTANQGKNLQDQINNLTNVSNLILAGAIDASTGLLTEVTSAGAAVVPPFVATQVLPSPALANDNYYVIVVQSGTFTPPGGVPTAAQNGDWFVSDGTAWLYLGVGARPPQASYTQQGIVQLANTAATLLGTSNTTAITPASLFGITSDSTSTTDSHSLASSTAVKSAYDLANAALPKAGGTMTGNLTFSGATVGVIFNDASNLRAISDSVVTTSSTTAASSTAVKSAYDLGFAALPKSGGTMTGAITFVAGQTFPISGIQDATTGQKGVVQVGTNIQVSSGTISVNTATTGQLGLVQVGSNIQVSSGTISVQNSSTAQTGVVQLNDTVASTSTTQALTANQGYQLQQQINALSTSNNVTFAGTFDAATSQMVTVTVEGAAVGFTIGSGLPAASASVAEYFVIVSVAGTTTPPGGSPTAANVGDWFLASASSWTYIAAGYLPPAASTTTPGIVELATNAETQAGTNSTNAVVPSALQSKMSDSVATTSSTTIASSTAVKSAYDLANAAVPKACYTALGALAAGTGASTVGTLALGTSGQFLAANSSCGAGLEWCTLSLACVPCSAFTASGQLLAGTGTSTFTALNVGSNNQILVADSACTGGLKWLTSQGAFLCGYTCSATPFNTALGANAGDSITTGTDNVSLGYNAGTAQVAGSQSVFIGSGAGQSTNAGGVTAIGFCAAQGNVSAGCGTYIGFVAGRNATGVSNTYVGSLSGCAASNSSACGTLLGFCAGAALTSGNGNTFLGFQTGRLVTTGGFNVAIGVATFQSATTGVCNVAIGCGALGGNITGNGSTAIGTRALTNTTGTAVNTAVGSEAGAQTTGTGNSYFGVNAGCAVNTGTCNTLIGRNSGTAITTGSCNTIVGSFAGSTTLSNNAVIADGAGNIKLQVNENGAVGVGSTPSYGTTGQLLQSNGTAAAPTWIDAVPWLRSTTTTTTTALTTVLTLPLATTRAVQVFLTASNTTTGRYHNDMYQVITDGTTANSQLTGGANIGANAYAWSVAVSGGNLLLQVTPNAASSTKFVVDYNVVAI